MIIMYIFNWECTKMFNYVDIKIARNDKSIHRINHKFVVRTDSNFKFKIQYSI